MTLHGINYDPQSDTGDCIVHKSDAGRLLDRRDGDNTEAMEKFVVIDSEGLKPDRKLGWGDNYPMYYLAWYQCMDYEETQQNSA